MERDWAQVKDEAALFEQDKPIVRLPVATHQNVAAEQHDPTPSVEETHDAEPSQPQTRNNNKPPNRYPRRKRNQARRRREDTSAALKAPNVSHAAGSSATPVPDGDPKLVNPVSRSKTQVRKEKKLRNKKSAKSSASKAPDTSHVAGSSSTAVPDQDLELANPAAAQFPNTSQDLDCHSTAVHDGDALAQASNTSQHTDSPSAAIPDPSQDVDCHPTAIQGGDAAAQALDPAELADGAAAQFPEASQDVGCYPTAVHDGDTATQAPDTSQHTGSPSAAVPEPSQDVDCFPAALHDGDAQVSNIHCTNRFVMSTAAVATAAALSYSTDDSDSCPGLTPSGSSLTLFGSQASSRASPSHHSDAMSIRSNMSVHVRSCTRQRERY